MQLVSSEGILHEMPGHIFWEKKKQQKYFIKVSAAN